jgi:hypothetical protein
MSPNSFLNKKLRNLNNGNHVLDLPTGIRLYLNNRLYDRDREIRSDTLFFRLDGILPANGLIKKKVKPIPTEKIARLIEQPISIKEKKKRRRR